MVRIPAPTLLALLPAAPAAAAEAARPAPPPEALPVGQWLQAALGLAAVLLLVFLLAWAWRRLTGHLTVAGGSLRVLGGLSLGARERLVLVQVGKRQLLLGVAPGRVQTVHVLEEPLPLEAPARGDGAGFARALRAAREARREGERSGRDRNGGTEP